MTEQEWLASDNMAHMSHEFIMDHKKLLFAAACCRQVWDFLSDKGKEAVEVLEEYVDSGSKKELTDAWYAASNVQCQDLQSRHANDTVRYAIDSTKWHYDYYIMNVAYYAHRVVSMNYCDLLRDIVNPYYKTTYNPSTQARNLADVIYKSKDWQALTILADLLEEEGCTDTKLLNHLRTTEQVYRGWWSLDFVCGV